MRSEKEYRHVTEGDVLDALAIRFAAPAYAFFPHVANGTGGRKSREADALAMSLWPSRGLELHGFEVKCSRRDWVSELSDPQKADDLARFCNRWWLAVADESIVKPGELPPTWGLLVLSRRGIDCKTEAPLLPEPQPLTLHFIAAILRRIHESYVPRAAFDKRVAEERAKADESATHAAGHDLTHLRESIAAFEAASGVAIERWAEGDIGEAVAMVLEHKHKLSRERLDRLRSEARAALETFDAIAALFPGEHT